MKIAENFMVGLYLSNWLSIKISSSETIPSAVLNIPCLHLKIIFLKEKQQTQLLCELSINKILLDECLPNKVFMKVFHSPIRVLLDYNFIVK